MAGLCEGGNGPQSSLKAICTSQWNHFGTRVPTPNSLDMNVLDLGYFREIQSLQHQSAPQTTDELIAVIETAFSQLTRNKLNNVFLTL
ncbi:hypothetical protein ANN_22675 [Periplaneta americana]|uniref:Uncharacterized protein n=1 Tax=Periplaneta americana TaxID=6978 RepID=A0ABQ8S9B6_PERAM|nr:hypothetical protein ANN_22675 [Periplaneta americana]